MKYYVMTLFPEMIEQAMNTSIMGRAMADGLISLQVMNIRDYTLNKHGKVDDYPYGGGAGMVMEAEPIYRCYEQICSEAGKRPRVIYLTPQGDVFSQKIAKDFSKEDVIQNKKHAIKKLNSMLEGFINDPSGQRLKKANLLSYWIKDYVRMLSFEETFDPKKNIAYKRGDIVKLNFGFNIGSEYGGLHYAIVINNKNPHSSSVVTVIPLTSQKNNNSTHPNDVELGNELYRNLKLKYDTIAQQVQAEEEEISKTLGLFDTLMKAVDENLSVPDNSPKSSDATKAARTYLEIAKDLKNEWEKKSEQNKLKTIQLNKIKAEIEQMKTGSIALVDQITTISKIRIYDPRNAYGVLSGIRLSPESLDKINNKIKELFIF